MKKNKIAYMAKIGVLGAVAAVIMLLEFPLPFAPPFYKLDLSESVVLMAGFAMGPMAAVLTELVKILLNLIFNGTVTALVGEIANFIIGVAFVLPAAFIYKKHKSFGFALLGMGVGSISLVILGAAVNYFIIIPAYARFMIPMDTIINMGTAVNSSIDSLWTLILFATVPFNLLKGVVCSIIATLVYKRVSPILHKEF